MAASNAQRRVPFLILFVNGILWSRSYQLEACHRFAQLVEDLLHHTRYWRVADDQRQFHHVINVAVRDRFDVSLCHEFERKLQRD